MLNWSIKCDNVVDNLYTVYGHLCNTPTRRQINQSINQSTNQPNLYSAPYEMWTVVLKKYNKTEGVIANRSTVSWTKQKSDNWPTRFQVRVRSLLRFRNHNMSPSWLLARWHTWLASFATLHTYVYKWTNSIYFNLTCVRVTVWTCTEHMSDSSVKPTRNYGQAGPFGLPVITVLPMWALAIIFIIY